MRANRAKPRRAGTRTAWIRFTTPVVAAVAAITMCLTGSFDRGRGGPAQPGSSTPVPATAGSLTADGTDRPSYDVGSAEPDVQELELVAERIAAFALAASLDGDTTRVARLEVAVTRAGAATDGLASSVDGAVHVSGLLDADRDGDDDDGDITIRRGTDQVCLHLVPPFAHYTLSTAACR